MAIPTSDAQVDSIKVPPHSVEAEQSVLGGLLLDNSAWDRVADMIAEGDFYRADHRQIYRHIVKLIGAARPADVVTVAESLDSTKDLAAIGGLAYLTALAAGTPSATNIRRYAEIVRERAILRQLAAVATDISDSAYSPMGRDASQILDEAESKVFEIAEQGARGSKGFQDMPHLLTQVVERIDMLYNRGGGNEVTGVPTGYVDLDRMTSGLQPGDLVIVAGRPSMGKAQPLDAKVKTVDGWKAMGDLRFGDELASVDGKRSLVSGVFPQGRRQIYRVTFSDGRSTRCCAEHLWKVHYREWDEPRTLDTARLMEMLQRQRYRHRLWIDAPSGDFGRHEELPLAPWLLGALLGDVHLDGGSVMFSTSENEMLARLEAEAGAAYTVRAAGGYDYRIAQTGGAHRSGVQGVNPNGIKEALRGLGLWGLRSEEKFVPQAYLLASREVRLDVLRGLLDTDGWVERWGSVRFCSVSERLARDVVELVRSIGGWATIRSKRTTYTYKGERREGRTAYVCNLHHDDPRSLFHLSSKRARLPVRPERAWRPVIVSIEADGEAETQCIAVTHPSRLYVTDDYVVTHNTSLAMNIAENVALEAKLPVGVFSMEMAGTQLVLRMLGSVGRLDQHKLRTGRLHDEDWKRLTDAVGRLNEAHIHVDETPALNPLELRARARRLHRQYKGLGLVVVDYLQLMSSASQGENRATEISEISRSLKGLAKELHCPVIALSQLNRSLEQRPNKRPVMSDLRECVTGDTLVLLADGSRVPIRDLVGTTPEVWAMDEERRIVAARSDRVWSVGVRPVLRVSLASGRVLRATGRHRLFSGSGWRRVDELHAGDRLAIARSLPTRANPEVWAEQALVLLGHLVGDGSYPVHQPMRYTTASEENSRAVAEAARSMGGQVTRHEGRGAWHQLVISGNGNRWHPAGVGKWLKDLGIFGQRSHEKRLPPNVFRLSGAQIGILLRHLWATDGCISLRAEGKRGAPRVYFSTCSRGLAEDVAALLLRLSIVARIRAVVSGDARPVFTVDVSGSEQQKIFLKRVGAFGPRVAPAERLRLHLQTTSVNTNVDTLPIEAFAQVREAMRAQGISQREMACLRGTSYGGSSHFRFAPSRDTLASYGRLLGDERLQRLAEDELFWDTIVAIEPDGEEEVFDLTVPGPASWLADGIVSHNSGAIEQDADLILFIYRDEVYNPESPDKGIAEVIIGKQRNGPIGTVQLAFLGEFTRFENLANPNRY